MAHHPEERRNARPRPGDGHNPPPISDPDAGDDHGGSGGVDPQALRDKHEPASFDLKAVLSVPMAVVVSFVIAFATVTGIFMYVQSPAYQPKVTNPRAGDNARAINDRLGQIYEQGPVSHPRLEGLKQYNDEGNPAWMRSYEPAKGGEYAEFHPEYLRASRIPALNDYGWVEKDKVARVPIDRAIDLVLDPKFDKALKSVKEPVNLYAAKPAQRPKMSNAGRGDGVGLEGRK